MASYECKSLSASKHSCMPTFASSSRLIFNSPKLQVASFRPFIRSHISTSTLVLVPKIFHNSTSERPNSAAFACSGLGDYKYRKSTKKPRNSVLSFSAKSMATMADIVQDFQAIPFATSVALGALTLMFFFMIFIRRIISKPKEGKLPSLPVVPGLPVIGNLLQLKEKKPHKTFAKWAEIYGPIYSIKAGASTVIVLNSTEVAQEAMVTRYPSISTRKLPKALQILTFNKCMVATSDYNEFHKTAKRCIMTNVLGATAQRRHRVHRDTMIENMTSQLHDHAKNFPLQAINFRKLIESELFGLAFKQALGKDVESIYVEELGKTLSREEMFKVLVTDLMEGAIEVDWRDFFPYLGWIPNKSFENKIQGTHFRRQAVMNALVKEQKKRIASGEEVNCYLDFLSSEAKTLSEEQMTMLLWETIIEIPDTTTVTTEWAMYELAKDPTHQERLYRELKSVCGNEKITEEKLSQIPYLSAIFHETLRKHSPVPIIPLRYAHEDTQVGGYHIPTGSEIAINIYACNMDEKSWENPEEWKPERFLDGKYEAMDLQKTMAFGAGKRACAGSLQAMLIACTTIGRLVQEFEWRLKDGEEANVDTTALTARKLHPVQVIPKPRE